MKSMALGLMVLASNTMANELAPIVFTSKQDVKASEMTSSVVVIENDVIENTSHQRATDLIKKVPGVFVEGQGIVGGQSNIYIRGADSKHTVILIDGVKVFDPTSIGGRFDLAQLNALDIEKIEVLKGPQSVLYGSDAIGGVINFITKKGNPKNNILVGTGIVNQAALSHSILSDKTITQVTGYYQESEVDSDVQDTDEKDKKINKGLSLTREHDYGKWTHKELLKITVDYADVDGADNSGNPIDSKSAYAKQTHSLFHNSLVFNKSEDEKVIFDLSYARFERINRSSSIFKTDGTVVDFETRYINGNYVLGFNHNFESARTSFNSEENLSVNELFYNHIVKKTEHTFEYGVRGVDNKDFGAHLVYSLGYKFDFNETHSLKTSAKSGYKAPSAYELFDPNYGNENLTPEKSKYFEVGYDLNLNSHSAGVVLFYNEVENYIGSNSNYISVNIDGYITRGVEIFSQHKLNQLTLGQTLSLNKYSLSDGKEAQKKPYEILKLSADYKINDKHSIGLNGIFNNRRFEYINSNTTKVELRAYETLDLQHNYTAKNYSVVTAIKNVFDRDYETSKGYSTQGLGAQVDFKYNY